MKKFIALLLALIMVVCCFAACTAKPTDTVKPDDTTNTDTTPDTNNDKTEAPRKVGFVTFGLGGEFFQTLADTFKAKMEAAGWEASYADGAFDPAAQVAACENYIAQKVDVLVIWAVAAPAVKGIISDAKAQGIKVVAFVCPLDEYDALMVSDDAELADNLCRLSAKWIDETYADADDHSVPVAVFSCRAADTGVLQADELIKIEEFSTKAKLVKEVALDSEEMTTGLEAAENLYATNPEIKVFLTAHNGLALGINNFFTASNSPVKDYSDMGVFAINGDSTSAAIIKEAVDGASPFRGMVLTGSVDDTANEMLYVITGIMDGTLPEGHLQKAGTVFVYGDTVDEYLTTGTVTSVTDKDFQ